MPVIILSARDDTDVKVAGLERGAHDYVTKPFRFEQALAGLGLPPRPGLQRGRRLRRLPPARARRDRIATVRGMGYALRS